MFKLQYIWVARRSRASRVQHGSTKVTQKLRWHIRSRNDILLDFTPRFGEFLVNVCRFKSHAAGVNRQSNPYASRKFILVLCLALLKECYRRTKARFGNQSSKYKSRLYGARIIRLAPFGCADSYPRAAPIDGN